MTNSECTRYYSADQREQKMNYQCDLLSDQTRVSEYTQSETDQHKFADC